MRMVKPSRIIAWSVTCLAAMATLIFTGHGLQVLAVAVVLVVGLRALDAGKTLAVQRIPSWCWQAAGPAILILLCGVQYHRLLLGDMPVNHDHPVMLLRAWITGTQLIPSGQLTGPSPTMFAGYPANALYPLGTDLLVCAVKALGLGLISWETAYCWALFLAVIAYPTALYAVGHRLGGPLAGLVAGLFGVADRGAWAQAGWDFSLNWGVWSMGLSFSLCLWTLWAFERLARLPGRRWLWLGASSALGGAILLHPMALAILGVALPLLMLALLFEGELEAPGLWMPRVISAALVGFGLCAFWLLPFIARQDWFEPLASPYRLYRDVIAGLLSGDLLRGLAPAVAVLGLAGLLVGASERNALALFLLVTTGILLYVSTDTFLLAFDVLKKLPALAHLQLERLTYLIRAALILGSGLLVARLLRPAKDAAGTRPPIGTAEVHARRFLLALALAPVVVIGPTSGPHPWFVPWRPLDWSSDSERYRDLRAVADFLNEQPGESLGRIALIPTDHDHSLMSLPVYTGLPVFRVGFTPENNYRYKFSSREPEVFQALNVSHVLSATPRHRTDLAEVRRFGGLRLYRFRDYSPDRFRLTGSGRAVLERDDRQALDIRLSGTGPDSRLIVFIGRYALWRAEIDARPAAVEGASVGDSPEAFMALDVHDGLLRLRWENKTIEWMSNLLSWLTLVVVIAVALAGWSRRFGDLMRSRFSPWSGRIHDGLTLTSLAGMMLALFVLVLKLLPPPPSPFEGRQVLADLSERLATARAEVIRPHRTEPCAQWNGSRLACPGPEWNYVGEVILSADQKLRQCIWLHPIQGAKHSVTFDEVPLGEHLRGHMALDDKVVHPPGPHAVHLTVLLDGQPVGRFTCPSRRGWFPWRVATPNRGGTTGRVTIQSDAPFTGRRHFCFTAYSTVSKQVGQGEQEVP